MTGIVTTALRIPPRGPLGHFVPGPLRFTALPAQSAGSVDLDGLAKAIAGQDDGQSNGGLGGRDGDNEDSEDLPG